MNIENTAHLVRTKREVLDIEQKLEFLFMQFQRKHQIDFERPDDYGIRGFSMFIHFDGFNVEAFKHVEEIRNIYTNFIRLRKEQRLLEVEYNVDVKIKKDIINDMRKSKMM